jgi:NAD(P)-dependent dehydrogenase (short-subunit alcohol dehydrogenase family)
MLDFGLAGKPLVVTGGASGIGRATSELAAAQGMPVGIIDRDSASVSAAVTGIQQAGGVAAGFVVDVRDRGGIRAAVTAIEKELGSPHGIVACAAISPQAVAEDLTEAQWTSVIDINLTGAFFSVQAVAERMLSRGMGSVVVIGSSDSLGGHTMRASYVASKHGIAGMVKSLAIDWGRRGVRVNAVAPGAVETPLLRKIHSQESLDENLLVRIPLGRVSTPTEQASACMFLLSDAASYISGIVLPVDGGLTAGYLNNLPIGARD